MICPAGRIGQLLRHRGDLKLRIGQRGQHTFGARMEGHAAELIEALAMRCRGNPCSTYQQYLFSTHCEAFPEPEP